MFPFWNSFRQRKSISFASTLFFSKRQRNRYASRALTFLILNGAAGLLLLANFLRLHPSIENAPKVANAMVVFGAGVAAALASFT
jgi:hypothetical protein